MAQDAARAAATTKKTKLEPNKKVLREGLRKQKEALEAEGWRFDYNEETQMWRAESKDGQTGTGYGDHRYLQALMNQIRGDLPQANADGFLEPFDMEFIGFTGQEIAIEELQRFQTAWTKGWKIAKAPQGHWNAERKNGDDRKEQALGFDSLSDLLDQIETLEKAGGMAEAFAADEAEEIAAAPQPEILLIPKGDFEALERVCNPYALTKNETGGRKKEPMKTFVAEFDGRLFISVGSCSPAISDRRNDYLTAHEVVPIEDYQGGIEATTLPEEWEKRGIMNDTGIRIVGTDDKVYVTTGKEFEVEDAEAYAQVMRLRGLIRDAINGDEKAVANLPADGKSVEEAAYFIEDAFRDEYGDWVEGFKDHSDDDFITQVKDFVIAHTQATAPPLPPINMELYNEAQADTSHEPAENLKSPEEVRADYFTEAIGTCEYIRTLEAKLPDFNLEKEKDKRLHEKAVKELEENRMSLQGYLVQTANYFGHLSAEYLRGEFKRLGFYFDDEYRLIPPPVEELTPDQLNANEVTIKAELESKGWFFDHINGFWQAKHNDINGKRVVFQHETFDGIFNQILEIKPPAPVNKHLPKTVTVSCRVELSDADVVRRSAEMTKAMSEIDRENAEFKQLQAEHKKRLEAINERIQKHRYAIDSRAEWRDLPCLEEFDYERGMCTVRRPDTGDIVKTRPLTADEMQGKLFN